MGLFRPYERSTSKPEDQTKDPVGRGRLSSLNASAAPAPTPGPSSVPDVELPETTPAVAGPRRKDAPTRTRRQAEAERMERLHPTLTPKEQRKADRVAREGARMEAMDRVEASPERQLLRDYVDTRWTINEFLLPGMILIMAATMLTINNVALSSYIAFGLWILMAMAIINTWIMWRGFKRLLSERHPGAEKRGLLMYMFNRAMMIRRFRRPTPRIARGEFR